MERKLHFSTISPKTTFYNSNGTGLLSPPLFFHKLLEKNKGRDTYIVVDNGGSIKHQSSPLPDIRPVGNKSNFVYRSHRNHYSIRKNNNITHYKSDGTGRDQYILVNEGGLSYPFESKNHCEALFSGSLRNYDKLGSSITNLRDYFRDAQRCKTPQEITQQRVLKATQKELIFRLTTPREKTRCKSYQSPFLIKSQ